jgi:hypothetical protein
VHPRRGLIHPSAPKCLENLSEKGCEQRSDRRFGRCTEAKMERKALSLAAHKVLLQATRGFSDSF